MSDGKESMQQTSQMENTDKGKNNMHNEQYAE